MRARVQREEGAGNGASLAGHKRASLHRAVRRHVMNLLAQVGAYRRVAGLLRDDSSPQSRSAPMKRCWLITFDAVTIKAEKRAGILPQSPDSGKSGNRLTGSAQPIYYECICGGVTTQAERNRLRGCGQEADHRERQGIAPR